MLNFRGWWSILEKGANLAPPNLPLYGSPFLSLLLECSTIQKTCTLTVAHTHTTLSIIYSYTTSHYRIFSGPFLLYMRKLPISERVVLLYKRTIIMICVSISPFLALGYRAINASPYSNIYSASARKGIILIIASK